MQNKDLLLTGRTSVRKEAKSESLNAGISKSKLTGRTALQNKLSETNYDEYLMAMKRIQHRHSILDAPSEIETARARRRKQSLKQTRLDGCGNYSMTDAARMGIIASMVPDEIIYKHCDYSIRSYETALMFCDVAGFTNLCEKYTSFGRGGPSRLTKVLNSYIGAMVQEILTHNGDVLKFSGDAFLSMWKKTGKLSMQDVVHNAIDCGLIIQKNYGTFKTDVGVILKVKVAISAGMSHFSIIGDEESSTSSYVIIGQPVWDVKMAQYMSKSGDVLTAASAWMYVNEAEYWTQPCGDGRHTKVLGVGASWKRVEKFRHYLADKKISDSGLSKSSSSASPETRPSLDILHKEFSLRPALVDAVRNPWISGLRRFMATPVLRAVDNEEPMEFLTEVRRVVVVFLNIITRTVTDDALIELVDAVYKLVSSVTLEADGLVNKVSMFDKDMMILIVFGLRGLSHEDEAQHALLCAFTLKDKIVDQNIISVSIGVTSGTTYCGVVGHALRREYTVIGPAVNKAARLMMSYENKVTCDKETFLRSKLDQEYFRQMEPKPMKGIAKPGPVYEFDYYGWPERPPGSRHPLLGRNEEIRKFKKALQNALEQQTKKFTRYRHHVYGIAFTGPETVGKSRLAEECLYVTPDYIRREKIILTEKDKNPYQLFRKVMMRYFKRGKSRSVRENKENKIRQTIDMEDLSPLQIHGINVIFDCRFPLPEKFDYTGDVLSESTIKMMLRDFFMKVLNNLTVIVVDDAQHIDDESWRLLLILLETKKLFFVLPVTNPSESLSDVAKKCLETNMILKVPLAGIDRMFHAALACQLLDVQAIPADLEKVIESASSGLPGWIQNFLIALVQRGALTIITLTRIEAAERPGIVMPALPMLLKNVEVEDHLPHKRSTQSLYTDMLSKRGSTISSTLSELETDTIQVAVLSDSYTFDDMKVDMAMDAIILKTYDSLKPFEKMLLKCGSVLGDIFSRRMLLSLLQSDSTRKIAKAVAKLFSIRVLECEGGDFTHDTSLVLVHPAPSPSDPKPPYCACLGTRRSPNCQDLPMYAFCGYMKFRHSLFRTTTYDLLTETQKLEMHARALLYLERYTRRCRSCGAGCFVRLLGLRCDDGLIVETEEQKKTRLQIYALSAEARMAGEENTSLYHNIHGDDLMFNMPADLATYDMLESEGHSMLEPRARRPSHTEQYLKNKRVRSFSSLEMEKCECLAILLSCYSQVIDHCRGAGEFQKLYEAYLEYTDLCINIHSNIPQAVRLLIEVEDFVKNENFYPNNMNKNWVKDFCMASVYSLRGICMLESGDHSEARKQLLHAMQLYKLPFPTSKHMRRFSNLEASFHQTMALYIAPNLYIERDSGIIGNFYEEISVTLHRMYRLFKEEKETANATLAAKWCLHYALRTNSNFRLLCVAYGNMISDYRRVHQFSKCQKLEERAMEVCRRKRGQLDVTEVPAVCYLYTSIFLFYVDHGKKIESLEFGLSVMHMVTNRTMMDTRISLVLCMLKLLLEDLKIHDMVTIMREFFYLTDQYDLCSETWYYYYAIVVLLDTGYCVESYSACETFYMKKGDALLRTKTTDAAWNFFVCMWLVTTRVGAWERSILWEEKIKQLMSLKMNKHEFNMMIVIRLVEGLLITLVREMDNRNIKKIEVLEKHLKSLFNDMEKACAKTPIYRSRYCLMLAYYKYISGKKHKAYSYLNKARDLAQAYSHLVLLVWIEHTREHWKGTLNPKYVDYWSVHIELDNLLDYRDFHAETSTIVPYTLPLPTDLDR
ncbi:hypothetical protein PYW08_005744 [Mythimna loreyi]|uniref:Uncharacterized protein n=1 Tax=Mythimna loreyi TaxID=667449 RepID=A0ACC2QHJ0_9NEOP|nr:hypothetical protein PYW08_005744 [Mythimna loreyi]